MSTRCTKVGWLVLLSLGSLLTMAACTTDLNSLVDDGVDEGGVTPMTLPDAAVDEFPPPIMEPSFQEPDPIVDPAGPFAFTVVHGIVDAQRIHFCSVEDGELRGDPWPEQGLPYGGRWVMGALDGVDPEQDDFQLLVIDADADHVDGRSCASIVADPLTVVTAGASIGALVRSEMPLSGQAFALLADAGSDAGIEAGLHDASIPDVGVLVPDGAVPFGDGGAVGDANTAPAPAEDAGPAVRPAIRVAYLPVIPAGTMSSLGSYLLSLAGCLGGDYFTTPEERAVCGSNYFPDRSTLAPMLVRMSRLVTFGNPSLQFLQASLGAGTTTLRSMPGVLNGGTQITIANDVAPGVIEPYPPLQSVAPNTYGSPLGVGSLELQSEIGSTWSDSWGNALEGLDIETLEGLKGYTLVFVGPSPWLQDEIDEPWWNEPQFVLVENSPVP